LKKSLVEAYIILGFTPLLSGALQGRAVKQCGAWRSRQSLAFTQGSIYVWYMPACGTKRQLEVGGAAVTDATVAVARVHTLHFWCTWWAGLLASRVCTQCCWEHPP
jgi:hypothetical protein